MTTAQLIRLRRDKWKELETLLSRLAVRRDLDAGEISRFATLYRSTCADLSRARSLSLADDLVDYLNDLAARSHNAFYLAPPGRRGAVKRFFKEVFPLSIADNGMYVATGFIIFFGPMTAMILLAAIDSDVLYDIVPRRMLEAFEAMYREGHGAGRAESTDLAMTGFYIKNNIGIAFQCFATGALFGLGTIFFEVYNGVTIGAVVGFIGNSPSAMNLLSFISGHGPLELTAIALAGGAGLRLGFGPISAGNRSRLQSFSAAATEAVILVLGAAALLLAAALVEGFFSPSSLPMILKFAFGGSSILFLVYYLGIYPKKVKRRATRNRLGRRREPR